MRSNGAGTQFKRKFKDQKSDEANSKPGAEVSEKPRNQMLKAKTMAM